MTAKEIILPFTAEMISSLKIGEKLLLSGKLITARDAAHQRMSELLKRGESLPFDLRENCIYYCGPTPAKPGFPIGACGPTTSGRMDVYAQLLFENGMRSMIGKGERSLKVVELIKKYQGVYLIAIGGAGALYGQCVTRSRCIAWSDLGAEAVYEIEVVDFPCFVGNV